MTVINGATLIDFVISPDGSRISINVTDENAKPGSLILPSECLHALLMSMPAMVQQALRHRHRDPSLRLVYPLGDWRLEMSTEPEKLILTLSTSDGFAVAFAVTGAELERFAQAAKRASQINLPPPN